MPSDFAARNRQQTFSRLHSGKLTQFFSRQAFIIDKYHLLDWVEGPHMKYAIQDADAEETDNGTYEQDRRAFPEEKKALAPFVQFIDFH
jgi:hypothetical protein